MQIAGDIRETVTGPKATRLQVPIGFSVQQFGDPRNLPRSSLIALLMFPDDSPGQLLITPRSLGEPPQVRTGTTSVYAMALNPARFCTLGAMEESHRRAFPPLLSVCSKLVPKHCGFGVHADFLYSAHPPTAGSVISVWSLLNSTVTQ